MNNISKFAFIAFMLLAGKSFAADLPRYNLVSLQANASREVQLDTIHISLYVQEQGKSASENAGKVSEKINKALEIIKNFNSNSNNQEVSSEAKDVVQFKTGNRQSYPIYDEKTKKITAYREKAEINLTSKNFAKTGELMTELLGVMQMQNMQFSLSENVRKLYEEELIDNAIKAFKAKVETVSKSLGGSSYQIVNLDINSSLHSISPMMRTARMDSEMASPKSTTQDFNIEAGTTNISVFVNGSVEINVKW